MRCEHRSHVVVLLELIIDLMKVSYEDWSWISWSWVIRLTMDLMKFSYETWSWISWCHFKRIDQWSHEVMSWGLIIYLSVVTRIFHRCHEVELSRWIINVKKLSYKDWSWMSWSWVIRLTMDLMKFSYETWSWISWCHFKRIDQWSHEVMSWGLIIYLSVVTRIFHRCHEVELSRWIINVKKLSYKDWSWMSWSWVMRIVHGSQEVEL